ncbi:MAG TPA: SDR family oxidoreductase [Anaerolineae bacterium]|jgi:acetoacetyl-CoA reductase/3-oxoacyl-[acyl-carrier protein] reductase
MLGLQGKVILVTGGNRGIGAAIVSLLEDMEVRVAYTYRSKPGSRGTLAIQADVTDTKTMKHVARQVEEELGPVYGIVANAGITGDALLSRMSPEKWHAVIDTNLNGVFNTISPIVPLMYECREGALVFISSVVGEQGNIGQANYAATKAALIGMAKTLGLEGARYGVRANVVAPGFTETDMVKAIPAEVKDKILQTIPLRRFATLEEVAWGVAFLLSPVAAAYITGTTLSINGGRHT